MRVLPWLSFGLIALFIAVCGNGDNGNGDGSTDAGDDPIKQQCGNDIWCYHDAVVALGDPDKCANINKYWTDTDQGVVGDCYYQIAKAKHDCAICSRIVKSDIYATCMKDCT